MTRPVRKVLAIASAGGHWEQLQLLRPAFAGHDILFVTTLAGLPERAGLSQFRIVQDCNADQKRAAMICFWQLMRIIRAHRPDHIVTTGALPGFLAILAGKAHGIKSVWIDSVANVEELSNAGRMARRVATQHLSQWPHVAKATNSTYAGRLL